MVTMKGKLILICLIWPTCVIYGKVICFDLDNNSFVKYFDQGYFCAIKKAFFSSNWSIAHVLVSPLCSFFVCIYSFLISNADGVATIFLVSNLVIGSNSVLSYTLS